MADEGQAVRGLQAATVTPERPLSPAAALWRAVPPAWALLAAYFLLSLLLVARFGLDTLGYALENHWHFLDLAELDRHPLRSLLDLHTQPPLLNAVAWLLGALPGDRYANFVVLNCLCNAAVAVILHNVLRRHLRLPFAPLLGSLAFLVSPAALLNAAYPFYASLTALGYAGLVWSFTTGGAHRRRGLHTLLLAGTYLVWLRSSFGLPHFAAVLALYLGAWRPGWRDWKTLTAVAVAVAACLAPSLKNQWRHGFFGPSSWAPVNLAAGWDLQELQLAGSYWPTPEQIQQARPSLTCRRSHGPQDQATVKSNGHANYNSCLYIEYAADVRARLWVSYRVQAHAQRIVRNLLAYLAPPESYEMLFNRDRLAAYARYQGIATLSVALTDTRVVRLLLVLVVVAAARQAFRGRLPWLRVPLLIALMHALTHVLSDGKEGARFVFDVEFIFYLCGTALAAQFLQERLAARRARTP